MQKKTLIAVDSSADIKKLDGYPDFCSVPLRIRTAKKEYIDDEQLDLYEMTHDLQTNKGRTSTSCPNVSDWLDAFKDYKEIFVLTITSSLSGSFNAANAAKDIYLEEHPDCKVYVHDSLSTGPEIALLAEKLSSVLISGASFEEARETLLAYGKKTRLLYVLECMKNLANNGRVSPIAARLAGVLGIRIVGTASADGKLELLAKYRGAAKTIEGIAEQLQKLGYNGRKINITHCLNPESAEALKKAVLDAYPDADVSVYSTAGLCGYYAEKGGMLIGFEA